MRRRERLVQVQVHHVGAEVAGTHLADQRVHVGAVHVKQRALGVQHFGDLVDLLLKHAQRVGIGEHQRGHIFVDLRHQRRDVHHAGGIRLQVLDRVAGHRRGRRIGAVRRIWNQHLLARIALRLQIRAHQQNAGQLAMRAGGGLQRDRIHAGDFDELLAQHLQDAQRALRNALRLIGMRLGQPGQPRHHLVHARVVLHGARAQRIHAVVHGVVPRGQAGEVADDFDLAHLGHVAQVLARLLAQQLRSIDLWHVERRQLVRLLARPTTVRTGALRSG